MNVLPIKPFETYEWLLKKHYAKRVPQIMHAFGLYENNILIGVVTYGIPSSPSLCMGICGKKYEKNVLELNRLCLINNQKNESSFLVGNSLKMLPKPTIVVSYADCGQNHIGYVYQATNFLYTGLSAERVDWAIKGMENKHSKTISDGMTLESIKEKYGDKFYYKERTRKHRYIYFVGNKYQKKEMLESLNYPPQNYPKGESKKYDAGANVDTQMVMFL